MSASAPTGDALRSQPVARALVRLALPILASQALRLAFQWVDALWARGLGVHATAAITTSVFVLWCVYALNDIFGAGLSAYVSQLVGAGQRDRAGVAVGKALAASGALGIGAAILGLTGADALYRIMDPANSVGGLGGTYLRIVLLGAPFLLTSQTCETAMRADGDTRTPLYVDLATILLNAALAPLLMYGVGPFPALGVAGAALATVIAQVAMFACYVALAMRRHSSLPLARHAQGPPVRIAGLARVGVPAALVGILFSAVYAAFVRAASPYGEAAVAIIGVANRIEALQFMLASSLGLAGGALLGQALGAGDVARADQVLRTVQRWALFEASLMTVAMFLAPALFLAGFTRDPALLEIGVPYLRVLALTLVATGVEIATADTVLASGHTREISAIYTVFSLLRIPLAAMVPKWWGAGVVGIAWLITITCTLRTIVLVAWCARGHWRRGLASELHTAPPSAG